MTSMTSLLTRLELENKALRRRVAALQAELDRRDSLATSDAVTAPSPGYHHQIPSGVTGCPLCCATGCDCERRR
jgi:hypothetical protein